MKHFIIPMMLMAAAALASCEKQNTLNVPEAQKGTYTYTLSATVPDMMETNGAGNAQAPTRTDYSNTGVFSWSAGDAISVLFNNGATDKFFTLTTTGSGAAADFTGTIDDGYVMGGTDGNKWALYPAGAHSVRFSEADGEKYPLLFNIPAVTDYTVSGFSANIPMYAISTDGTSLPFQHLGAAYKFAFSGIKSATKVRFVVENQTTYRLSGDVKLRNQGGTYLDQAYAEGVDKTLTYVSNVSDGKATFYVPVRYYAECFQPIITLYNADTDGQLYTNTATLAKGIEKGHVQPINITVSGAEVPWSLESAFGVDWTSGSVVSAAGGIGVNKLSAYADATDLFVLLEVQKSALVMDPSHAKDCSVNFLVDGSRYFGYLVASGVAGLNDNSGYVTGKTVTEHLGVLYYEWKINRASAAEKTELVSLGSAGTVGIRFLLYPNNSSVGTDWDTYIWAPADAALNITLP